MFPNAIFGFIHLYGLMIGIGILSAFGVLFLYGKKLSIDGKFLDFLFYNGIVSIAFGFLSATLFQSAYNYIKNPGEGFRFGSGMTFLGGLIGGVVCFLIGYSVCRKRYTAKLFDVISVFPCCITIAHGFGRIGCFFAGCCYGKEIFLQRDYRINISTGRVYRLMNQMNLPKMSTVKPFRHKSKSASDENCENILNQKFNPTSPNKVWCCDFTYIKVAGRFYYLCVIARPASEVSPDFPRSLIADSFFHGASRILQHLCDIRYDDHALIFNLLGQKIIPIIDGNIARFWIGQR